MLKARMGQPVGQGAVVGQEHKAFAVEVKPANRKDAANAAREQMRDRPATAPVPANVAEYAARLVDSVVDVAAGDRNRAAVDSDRDLGRIHFGSQLCDYPAVNPDAARSNEGFAGSPAGNAGRSQHLLQTLFCHVTPTCARGDSPNGEQPL